MEEKQAALFKLLGVESRIRIIELLKKRGKMGVGEISEILGITPSAISQHIKALKHGGLVKGERKGYFIPYEIDPSSLLKCQEVLVRLCSCGCLDRGEKGRDDGEKLPDRLEFLTFYKNILDQELHRIKEEIAKIEE